MNGQIPSGSLLPKLGILMTSTYCSNSKTDIPEIPVPLVAPICHIPARWHLLPPHITSAHGVCESGQWPLSPGNT